MLGPARVLSLAAAAALVGGCGGGVFACADLDDCAAADGAGVCQPAGWCSFPDDACPSGQRYGDHAGDGLAGECVVEDAGTSGSTTPEPTATTLDGTATTATASASSTSPTGSATVSETGEASSEGTDTEPAGTTTAGDDCIVEEFDGNELGPGWTVDGEGPYVAQVQDGALELTPPNGGEGAVNVESVAIYPSADHSLVVEIVQFHSVMSQAELRIDLLVDPEAGGTDLLRVALGEGSWGVSFGPSPSPPSLVSRAFAEERFVRFAATPTELVVQLSTDGVDWDDLLSVPPSFGFAEFRLRLAMTNWDQATNPGTVRFERLAFCPAGE